LGKLEIIAEPEKGLPKYYPAQPKKRVHHAAGLAILSYLIPGVECWTIHEKASMKLTNGYF
jgi:hypothetical protein